MPPVITSLPSFCPALLPYYPVLPNLYTMRVNGPAMRAIRTDRGTSLRQLAAATGVSAGYLSRIERGERGTAWVHDETAAAIAAALGMPLDVITARAA